MIGRMTQCQDCQVAFVVKYYLNSILATKYKIPLLEKCQFGTTICDKKIAINFVTKKSFSCISEITLNL
jgi:hypothetical protein